MKKTSDGIPFCELTYSGLESLEVMLRSKDVIVLFKESRFKGMKRGASGVVGTFLDAS